MTRLYKYTQLKSKELDTSFKNNIQKLRAPSLQALAALIDHMHTTNDCLILNPQLAATTSFYLSRTPSHPNQAGPSCLIFFFPLIHTSCIYDNHNGIRFSSRSCTKPIILALSHPRVVSSKVSLRGTKPHPKPILEAGIKRSKPDPLPYSHKCAESRHTVQRLSSRFRRVNQFDRTLDDLVNRPTFTRKTLYVEQVTNLIACAQ